MKRLGVGGVIGLGGRESRLQGEGRQGIDAPKYLVTAIARSKHRANPQSRTIAEAGDEREQDDDPENSGSECESLESRVR